MSVVEQLPDLPGRIQGVKCTSPLIVQCPICGDCYSTSSGVTAGLCVPFEARAGIPGRRCLDCWADLGWYGGAYDRVWGGDPADAHRLLDRDYPTRHENRVSVEEAKRLIAGDNA